MLQSWREAFAQVLRSPQLLLPAWAAAIFGYVLRLAYTALMVHMRGGRGVRMHDLIISPPSQSAVVFFTALAYLSQFLTLWAWCVAFVFTAANAREEIPSAGRIFATGRAAVWSRFGSIAIFAFILYCANTVMNEALSRGMMLGQVSDHLGQKGVWLIIILGASMIAYFAAVFGLRLLAPERDFSASETSRAGWLAVQAVVFTVVMVFATTVPDIQFHAIIQRRLFSIAMALVTSLPLTLAYLTIGRVATQDSLFAVEADGLSPEG